jgi:NDP-sugar pyrophosphorylase family protein
VAGTIRAVRFPGRMVDIGTPESLAAAEARA